MYVSYKVAKLFSHLDVNNNANKSCEKLGHIIHYDNDTVYKWYLVALNSTMDVVITTYLSYTFIPYKPGDIL